MRKMILILIISLSLFLAGCGARQSVLLADVSDTESEPETTEYTDESESMETISQSTNSFSSTVSATNAPAPKSTQKAQNETMPATTTKKTEAIPVTGEKEISLDITSASDMGTVHFSKAKIDYEFKQVGFYFSVSAPNKTDIKGETIHLNLSDRTCKVYNGSLPTPVQQSDGTYKADNCYVSFLYIPDGSSPMTFSYAFTGGEAQTVQIDLPTA